MVALLLAAGESTRMGRPKQLLDWEGQALIEYQIRELLAAGVDEVIAVLGHRADDIRPVAERAGARTVLNAAYREGRAGSVCAGARAVSSDAAAVVILNVDQPRRREITRVLVQAHLRGGNLITVPEYQGRRGHPVMLAGGLLSELQDVQESSEGLRAVMRRHESGKVELHVEDPSVLLDLNLPGDYEAARASTSVDLP